MIKENTLQSQMNKFWQALGDTQDELNTFINGGLPPSIVKRHKQFEKKWERMTNQASELCDAIEQEADAALEPVEIKLPWPDQSFAQIWQEWKDYLAEQHHKRMKSRMERAALSYLKHITNDDVKVAQEYLEFAMANGYPRFFKVTIKNYETPVNEGGRDDGDF